MHFIGFNLLGEYKTVTHKCWGAFLPRALARHNRSLALSQANCMEIGPRNWRTIKIFHECCIHFFTKYFFPVRSLRIAKYSKRWSAALHPSWQRGGSSDTRPTLSLLVGPCHESKSIQWDIYYVERPIFDHISWFCTFFGHNTLKKHEFFLASHINTRKFPIFPSFWSKSSSASTAKGQKRDRRSAKEQERPVKKNNLTIFIVL